MITDPKVDRYADAIIRAIVEAAEAAGDPDINSALAALAYSQAYLLAKLSPGKRIEAETILAWQLKDQTEKFVAEGEPAGAPDSPTSAVSDWVLVPREGTREMFEAFWRTHFGEAVPGGITDAECYSAMLAASPPPPVSEPDAYDAGLLSDYGGGNVGWWQDYIRAELGRAHEHYAAQLVAWMEAATAAGAVNG